MYRTALKTSVVAHLTEGGTFSPPPPVAQRPSNSTPIDAHYSFNMAQQVFYPNDPLQPGPMYFLTPRKCAIFGVCCESIPQQENYLIDEAPLTWGRAPTPLLVCSVVSLYTMGWAKRLYTCTPTTVVGKNATIDKVFRECAKICFKSVHERVGILTMKACSHLAT